MQPLFCIRCLMLSLNECLKLTKISIYAKVFRTEYCPLHNDQWVISRGRRGVTQSHSYRQLESSVFQYIISRN